MAHPDPHKAISSMPSSKSASDPSLREVFFPASLSKTLFFAGTQDRFSYLEQHAEVWWLLRLADNVARTRVSASEANQQVLWRPRVQEQWASDDRIERWLQGWHRLSRLRRLSSQAATKNLCSSPWSPADCRHAYNPQWQNCAAGHSKGCKVGRLWWL